MVIQIAVPDIRHVADSAKRRRIVLAGAVFPDVCVGDMDLSGRMLETQEHAWARGNGVFLVVDVGDGVVGVDPVGEGGVADAGKAKDNCGVGCTGGEMERKVDGVKDRKGSA